MRLSLVLAALAFAPPAAAQLSPSSVGPLSSSASDPAQMGERIVAESRARAAASAAQSRQTELTIQGLQAGASAAPEVSARQQARIRTARERLQARRDAETEALARENRENLRLQLTDPAAAADAAARGSPPRS